MTQPLSTTHAARSSFAFSYYQAIIPYVLLITLLCSSTQFAWARRKDKDRNLAKDIADAYAKSFGGDANDDEKEKAEKELTAANNKKTPPHQVRPPELRKATVLEVAFAILAKSGIFDWLQQHMEPILEKAWKPLKLFYGTPSDPGYHLLSRINRTTTTLGEAVLASFLVMPTSNLATLRERQHIIQTFLDNPRAVEELERALQTYEDGEQSFLSLWTKTDPLVGKEYQKYMNRKFYYKNNNAANKSATWLELGKQLWRDFCDIQLPELVCWGPGLCVALQKIRAKIFAIPISSMWNVGVVAAIPVYRSIKLVSLLSNPEEFAIQMANLLGEGESIIDRAQDSIEIEEMIAPLTNNLSLVALYLAIVEAGVCFSAYQGYRNYQEYSSVLRNLALRMADVQNFIRVLQQVSETIAASPALEKVYGKKLTSIRKLLAQAKENTELGRLIHYLQHLPFQHWNYFLNNAGKLLASYKLFIEHKDAFADAMYELGQLDAYLSCVTLMQESQANNSNHAYTFVTFLDREQKSTPYIKITEMWNPFLDPKQAVGNSIEMDGAPGRVRNMILTGPNAGGKSTYLAAVIICLLFAQTFGIAPAQEAVITPFNKISTFIEKGDDVAAAQSLFMAEVKRAQEYVESVTGLKPEEFSFAIFDELFSGTNPKEGAAAEYGLLYALGAYSNSLSIVATHYPTVMQLEELAPDKGFVNYKVYSTRDSDGTIHYTYKIVLDKSNQAIAIDILEEQGFDSEIMEKAKEVLNNPDQYNAEFKEETGETRDLVQYKPGDTPGTEEGEEDEEDLVEYKPEGSVATKD